VPFCVLSANSCVFSWTFHLLSGLIVLPKRQEENNMTSEKVQREFIDIITKNGFTEAARTTDTNNIIYHRVWQKEDETLEVRIMLSHTYALVTVRHNGNDDPKFIRDYSGPKRAMSAIRTMVRNRGFIW